MLKLQWIEIFLRLIPEMLLIIWGIYVVTKQSINMKSYLLSSIFMALLVFIIRMLPIYFAIHTFLNAVLLICILVITGMPMVKAICGTLFITLTFCLSEFLNISILNILNININSAMANPIIMSALGIPSLIIQFLFTIILSYFIKKKEVLKKLSD